MKLKVELPYNPAVPLLDSYPEQAVIPECTPVFTAALLTIARSTRFSSHLVPS